ncbi:MAG: SPFH domain-containing protein [Anaerovoracaceae bacterium]|nr:SPFH domain-containing protein [Anaerovoracaceae bacterium]
MVVLIVNTIFIIGAFALFMLGIIRLDLGISIIGAMYGFILGPFIYMGLKILKPNEAYVLTLFGKYYGSLKGAGFYYVNPFCGATNPVAEAEKASLGEMLLAGSKGGTKRTSSQQTSHKKISLKTMTLSNEKQKINDEEGNPIEIGIVVIWRVVNTAKAVFNVDNFQEFLSIQCDSALRNIVRTYPYDTPPGRDEESLRGSSQEVAEKLKFAIQEKVEDAGLLIVEARITHLAYSQEIASAMLQRQQARAIIDARAMIVEGAVGMVEMAIEKLGEKNVVNLDDERKAAMVSNLMVILCGSKDAQPIVNSGSLY